jgi:hypothetical protein
MNIRDFRVAIESTLVSVLGTYRLPNGATTPSIAVRAYGESLAAGTVVEGLEVIIIREPDPAPIAQYRQQTASDSWTLFLVDWSGQVSLQEVAGKLLWAWPGSRATTIQMPQGVGARSQMRVDIVTRPSFTAT